MIIQKMDISSPVPSDPTASNPRTRYGRVSKPPVRYEPVEHVEDDYAPEDYDSNDPSDVSSEILTDSDEEEDESDADEYGNLDGFVVPDKNESDVEYTDGESSVSSEERSAPSTPRGGNTGRVAAPTRRTTRKSRIS
jgi:hypothetical protein